MSEVREKLKPYLNKRVTVRGTLANWDDYWTRNHRPVGRACITKPEIDAEVVCDHVWVVDVPHWKDYRHALGSQVTFDAIVQSYPDRATGKTNYCFGNASELTLLHQPPALVTPEPQEQDTPREYLPSPSDDEIEPQRDSAPAATEATPMERIRQVRVFAKACGSYDKAEEILASLPPMPLPELLDYIKVLKE